jgi:hypothetical protein
MTYRLAVPAEIATVCLTSCGRPDLLWRTLDSFLAHHAPERLIVSEDGEDAEFAAAIRARYPRAELMFNQPKKGQFASIDAMYAMVASPYVLHLEDDWVFDGPAPLRAARALLERRPDLAMVAFRSVAEFNPKYRRRSLAESEAGESFLIVPRDAHPVRFGYTFNPGLAPLAIWRKFGPFLPHHTEARLSKAVKEAGLTMSYASPGVARHIGDGRHVGDPFTIADEPAAWKRWLTKVRRLFDPMHGR